jgi:hypothetical protein
VVYIVASEGSRIICGMPIIRRTRGPFCSYVSTDWGSPVLLENNQVALGMVLRRFSVLGTERGVSHLLISDYFNKCQLLGDMGFGVKPCLFHIVELTVPFENMFRGKINKSRRKNALAAVNAANSLYK